MSGFLFTGTKRLPEFREQARGRKFNGAQAEFTACPIRRLPGSTIQSWLSAAAVGPADAWNAQTIWSSSDFKIPKKRNLQTQKVPLVVLQELKSDCQTWTAGRDRRAETGGPRPAGQNSALLLLNGGHGLHGGVVQVLRCGDGQAALRQDPLGLVHVGSWQRGEENGYRGGVPTRSNQRERRRWRLGGVTGERREVS